MIPQAKRAVFLDRDGVLNEAFVRDGVPHPPADVEQVRVLPGVAEALERLRSAGWELVVVTNQPDVARGAQTRTRWKCSTSSAKWKGRRVCLSMT